MRLTKRQRELRAEVSDLIHLQGLSSEISHVDANLRTTYLELARRSLITSGILSRYLYIDELLSDLFCREFFPNRTFAQLWRTVKFKAFNHYVLERLYLVQKADFLRARGQLPKTIYKDLMALNELRNAVAHSFFPENRRVRPAWKGTDVLSKAGFEGFWYDTLIVGDFLVRKLSQITRRDRGAVMESKSTAIF